jgi:hypothetical protein
MIRLGLEIKSAIYPNANVQVFHEMHGSLHRDPHGNERLKILYELMGFWYSFLRCLNGWTSREVHIKVAMIHL